MGGPQLNAEVIDAQRKTERALFGYALFTFVGHLIQTSHLVGLSEVCARFLRPAALNVCRWAFISGSFSVPRLEIKPQT
jgi:hypothetical protein